MNAPAYDALLWSGLDARPFDQASADIVDEATCRSQPAADRHAVGQPP